MGNSNIKPLSEEELSLFVEATQLDKEMIKTNYELFNTLPEDGKLTPAQCTQIFGAFFLGKNFDSLIKQMFESFDINRSGYLDFREFLVSIAIFETNDENKSFTRFLFKIGDKDQNNGIDRKELRQLLSFFLDFNLLDAFSKSDFFDKADLDSQIEIIFEKYDIKNKGFLNQEEFSNAFCEINSKINY